MANTLLDPLDELLKKQAEDPLAQVFYPPDEEMPQDAAATAPPGVRIRSAFIAPDTVAPAELSRFQLGPSRERVPPVLTRLQQSEIAETPASEATTIYRPTPVQRSISVDQGITESSERWPEQPLEQDLARRVVALEKYDRRQRLRELLGDAL